MKKFFVSFLFLAVFPLNSATHSSTSSWVETAEGHFIQKSDEYSIHVIQQVADGFPIEAVLVIPKAYPEAAHCIAMIKSFPQQHLDLNDAKEKCTAFQRPFVYLFPRGSRLLDDSYPTKHVERTHSLSKENLLEIEKIASKDYGGKHIDDLKKLLESAEHFIKGKFIIYGGSLGGYMAVQALLHPEMKTLLAAGVSVSGFYSLDTTRFIKGKLPDIALEAYLYTLSDTEKDRLLTPQSYVNLNIERVVLLPAEELKKRANPVDCAHQITVPLLVIHGENDYTTLCSPEGARAFKANAPTCTYVEIPGATHQNISDHPEFIEALSRFLVANNF
jgi:dienelactone hydrolase